MTTKEKVLRKLSGSKDKSVSGEILADICGVSRAAIWKAVKSLREEGYAIEGTTNGGYLFTDSDVFSTEIFREQFFSKYPEYKNSYIECFKTIDSTNNYAKQILAECGNLRNADGSLTKAGEKYHCSVIIAESQSAGRGRLGRTFVSPEKTGIYISLIYAPKGGIKNPSRLTACAAVAICRAINNLFDKENIKPEIKWINDIFLGGKKICGILAEGVTNFESGLIESAIIGIGINLRPNSTAFQGELKNLAGSLEEGFKESVSEFPSSGCENNNDTASPLSRSVIAAEIAGQVFNIFEEDISNHKMIMEEYKSKSFLLGQEITVFPLIGDTKKSYKAIASDIDENAQLIVTLKDGSRRIINSGEVSLKSKNFNK